MAIFSAQGLATAPVTNMLDEGKYVVQVNKAESIVSKQKGTPGVQFNLTVLDGQMQLATQSNPAGKNLFYSIYVSNDGPGRAIGLQKIAKMCKVCGIPQADDLDLDAFVGKDLIVRVKHKDDREEIADVYELKV